jgi:myo-inositol-1(or 4)-monophosphatase
MTPINLPDSPPTPLAPKAALHFAEELARQAGELIVAERASQQFTLSYKEGVELLTSADLKSDRLICTAIETAFPDHHILSEESSPDLDNPQTLRQSLWIIDPIDGTVNFAYNQHQVAIAIAYAENGHLLAGVVHCPFQNETFTAFRGGGAQLNGQPIRNSDCTDLEQALIGTGFPYKRQRRQALMAHLEKVLLHCRDIRRVGSAAADICWVAMGRLEGYYESVNPWDLAAACLIAREAGAKVGHLGPVEGNMPEEFYGKELVVAAPGIYQKLTDLLNS